jgi:hypothetical protein
MATSRSSTVSGRPHLGHAAASEQPSQLVAVGEDATCAHASPFDPALTAVDERLPVAEPTNVGVRPLVAVTAAGLPG